MAEMEQALAKIRPHTSSNLAHQKTPAALLHALESTFQEQSSERSPTAYFAALLTTLDGTLQKKEIHLGDGDVLPAELYLLALVAPFVPPPIIRSNLHTILTLTTPLFPPLLAHAPPLRSQLTLYRAIFLSLDKSQLETQGIRQAFASILQLCVDSRPKVRRKAADLVKDVLSFPPTPMARHPYANRTADWIKSTLEEARTVVLGRSKPIGKSPETTETAIHVLALLRQVVSSLPPSTLPSITNVLLTLPRLGNPYLSQSAYAILSDLLSFSMDSEESGVTGQIPEVLKAVLSSPPIKTDKALAPAWLQVLGNAMLAYNITDPEGCAAELGKVWKTTWTYLESVDSSTRKAGSESLGLLAQCITPTLIEPAIKEASRDTPRSPLSKIISQVTKSVDSLAYARSMSEVLSVISSLISGLRYRDSSRMSPTAAERLLAPLIHKVGDLRIQKGFDYKEGADLVLATAMRVVGPEVLLRVLPLNLEPADRQRGHEPRAYLLPLLAQRHPSPLSHFITYFVPLSERLFDLQQKADAEGRQAEAKVWSVLVAQIWTGLAGYCWGTVDLKSAFTPGFSQILSQLLYGQPELRPAVLKALKIMVDSNVSLASPKDSTTPQPDTISSEEAAQNLDFLRTHTESWLAVFFNVFGSVGRDGRGMVGEVISAWAAIAGQQEIAKTYNKVVDLFRQSLPKPQSTPGIAPSGDNITTTTLDLLVLLIPYLSHIDATSLFQVCLSAEVLASKDNGVQKRGYKTLVKLLENGKVTIEVEVVLHRLEELSNHLSPAAKKDRFTLLMLLIPLIPASAMHVIPSLIPEAVLGTKEPSDKTRSAAFELVLAMGRKMTEGGVVKRGMVDDMDEDGNEVMASIDEYITMIAGGLAGASPHMISATVTAISRLVFEFKDIITPHMNTEIFTTLLVFLTSANREIVKSILGFVKLAIHTLPVDLVRPHLQQLVPALLGWSHDHKNHFKAKVRHIFERMLRRFGWDDVYACAGEEDAAKVLVNIKKRKERAKRKRFREEEGLEDEEMPSTKPAAGDAFEDVLYGSESELVESDDEVGQLAGPSNTQAKQKEKAKRVRLRVDDDEPMDLLQGSASRIINAETHKRRHPGQDAARFKTDQDTGKMIIGDSGSDSEASPMKITGGDVAGAAYLESITSVDGFTRGPNGRVKFNKDTKKRRRDNDNIDEDVEMADMAVAGVGRKNRRKSDLKFGHEFKAKRAGGDVKKGGIDPYAYMSLSQAAKKSGRKGHGRIGIAGKR